MEEYLSKSLTGYVSCIRINGKPILPPLVDEKRRGELTHYKNLAILAEKKLCDRKILQNDRQSVDSGVIVSGIGIPTSSLPSPRSELQQVNRKVKPRPSHLNLPKQCTTVNDHDDSNIFDVLLATKPDFDDATLNFLMNYCDEYCRLFNCRKSDNESVIASETDGKYKSPNTPCVESSSEKDFLSSYASVEVTEKCHELNVLSQEDKSSEKIEKCESEIERIEFCSSDGVTDITFTDRECDNISQVCVEEQFSDGVKKAFQFDDSLRKNGDVSCGLSLKSPALHLIPPSDRLSISKSVGGHSIFSPAPHVAVHMKSDSQGHISAFLTPQSEKNSARELPVSEKHPGFQEVDCKLSHRCEGLSSGTPYNLTLSSLNTLNVTSLEKQIDAARLQEVTSVSGVLSKDLENSCASSGTVVESHCSDVTVSEPGHEKIYDPSLYEGNGACQRLTLEGTDIKMKVSQNSPLVDEKDYVDTVPNSGQVGEKGYVDTVFNSARVDEKGCVDTVSNSAQVDVKGYIDSVQNSAQVHESQIEGTICQDLEDSNTDHSVHKLSGDAPCIPTNEASLQVGICATVSATVIASVPENFRSTSESDELEKESTSSPPRLLRQNSYTLEAPSAALLAHMKGMRGSVENSEEEETKSKGGFNKSAKEKGKGRKGWNLEKAKSEWKSDSGSRLIFAVPCKESQAVRPVTERQVTRRKVSGKVGSSLPGSCVSSPVKTNTCHSSLDNISPMGMKKSSNCPRFLPFPFEKGSRKSMSKTQPLFHNEKKSGCSVSYSDLYEINQSGRSSHMRTRSKSDVSEETTRKKGAPVGKVSQQQHTLSTGNSVIQKARPEGCSSVHKSQKAKPQEDRSQKSFLAKSIEELFKNTSVTSTLSDSAKESESESCVMSKEEKSEGSRSSDRSLVERGTQSSISVTTPRSDLTVQEIFQQLQSQHSLFIAQLLERQKKEQESLAATFLNQQRLLLQEMNLIPSPSSSSGSPQKSVEIHDSGTHIPLFQAASSESNTCCPGSNFSTVMEMTSLSETSRSNRYSSDSTLPNSEQLLRNEEFQIPKERPEIPLKATNNVQEKISSPNVSPREQKAATIINAGVRGYLTRRLFKTEHVQSIIKTISETVQCALQLQRECPGDITPSDIELHKRLIQQLTAACYALHDTFFALSVPERMDIIRNDRERMRRNLQIRPSSSISSATQKYLQRKQQEQQGARMSRDRPTSSRRSWWQCKNRASSGGQYEQFPNSYSKSKAPQNNRGNRRPWR